MTLRRTSPSIVAFTLVELMVVVGIVGVLAGLLLPALAAAKDRSQSIYCVNSLHQMAISSKLYVDDNTGRFPWTFTLEGAQLERKTWFTYSQLYQPNRRLWLCPVRPRTIALSPISPQGFFKRSAAGEIIYPADGTVVNYAFNFEIGGGKVEGWYEFLPMGEGDIRSPAAKVHITDSGSRVVETADPQKSVTSKSPDKHGAWILADPSSPKAESFEAKTDNPNWGGPQLRHLGKSKSNVLFVDGHVDTLRSATWYWAGTPWLKAGEGE